MVSARGKGICQLTVGYAFNGVTWRVIDQLWGQDGWLSGKFSRVKDRPMLSAQGGVADVTKPSPVTPAKQRWDPCSGPPTDWVVADPGDGPGAPLIFGPNKNFGGKPAPTPPCPLPYLKVWIRHCRPFMVHTQIPVYRWRLRAWIAALFHRQT